MSILLKNTTFIDWQNLAFKPCDILLEEGVHGTIKFYAPNEKQDLKDVQVLDCSGKYVTKSFAIGHHHAYSALAKGMPAPKKSPADFLEILQYIWWNLDKCLNREMVEYSALTTAMACAKAGSTFVIDHHASSGFIRGSLELMAKAFEKVGVGHLLCYEITDRDGQEKAEEGLEETASFLSHQKGLIGLHASFTVGEATLSKAVRIMQQYQTGIHIHVAEDIFDQTHCHDTYHKTVIERLHQAGVLSAPETILVHGLYLNEKERNLIANSPVWMVQNPESNLNNKVGFFNSKNLGDKIMIGTDGMHSDILQSSKVAFLAGQAYDQINYEDTYNRLRNVHRYLHENNFSGDGDNNLIVLDYDTATDFNTSNFFGHFIFGLRSNHIYHVISDGRLIVKNRILQTVDEESLLVESRKLSKILWSKMQS
ncbi:MAG: amidohydrolase [Bacteroidetes bacterium HGW-Bacteroidetes-1]|jgi:cytosine/adenosine deaminase-related metal-dependent hydrolase|nr:MAG: amidohydrolase [Bacteroidetes bacterium HGW-Bacteroidetes-1]